MQSTSSRPHSEAHLGWLPPLVGQSSVSGPGEGRGISVLDPVPGRVVCTAVRGADRMGKRLGSDPFRLGLFS